MVYRDNGCRIVAGRSLNFDDERRGTYLVSTCMLGFARCSFPTSTAGGGPRSSSLKGRNPKLAMSVFAFQVAFAGGAILDAPSFDSELRPSMSSNDKVFCRLHRSLALSIKQLKPFRSAVSLIGIIYISTGSTVGFNFHSASFSLIRRLTIHGFPSTYRHLYGCIGYFGEFPVVPGCRGYRLATCWFPCSGSNAPQPRT
jgi:hypothetical protein